MLKEYFVKISTIILTWTSWNFESFSIANHYSCRYHRVCELRCSVVSDSFAAPSTVACQAPLSMGFSRQEYWSGLPFPSPGGLPNPGIQPGSPALAGRLFTTSATGEAQDITGEIMNNKWDPFLLIYCTLVYSGILCTNHCTVSCPILCR